MPQRIYLANGTFLPSIKSVAFLTRGCIRNCSGSIAPHKEGKIRKYADSTEFLAH